MSADAPARALARWAAAPGTHASGRALELALNAWLDVCACMVAGAGDEATRRVARAAAAWGGAGASVVGRRELLSAPGAALVNGTAAHALDFDDNFHPMAGHATAVLVPAIMAAAERCGASGLAALDAYVTGLEVAAVIGDAVGLGHYERGWHSTSTIGAMAAAAACARVAGLDADGMGRAIGLGFSFASGTKRQFGTRAKPMHAGMAAMHGVMAADLAAAGMDAHPEPLEGPWGFRDLFAGASSPGFEVPLAGIGDPLAIERHGLKAKIHPCCASSHCAVDGVVALMREQALSPADVSAVEVAVLPMSRDNLMYDRPATEMEARFSMHYAVALAVLQGGMGLEDFTAQAIARTEVRAWLARVEMRLPRDGEPIARADNGREPAQVTLRLADGRTLTRYVQHAVGTLQCPMTPAQLAAKLAGCATDRLSPGEQQRLSAAVGSLASAKEIGVLMALLRSARRAPADA